jgi:hypothetical protein
MLKLWQFLLHGCWHDWKHIGTGKTTFGGEVAGQYYCYKCSKCDRIEERIP